MVRAGWCPNLVAYHRRAGTVGAMSDTVQLRCTTTDGKEASFAEIVAAVYAGGANPDDYRVELVAATVHPVTPPPTDDGTSADY